MTKLTIVANITAKQDKIELVKTALLKLVELTRTEEGCVAYDLHQDNKNAAHFMVYEIWQSYEAWQVHGKTPHFTEFSAAIEGAIAESAVSQMTQIA